MSELTCGSLFSGVGGMDIGLAWAGFRHLFLCEIDPYCQAVLRARFPGVHIYSDVRDVGVEVHGGLREPNAGGNGQADGDGQSDERPDSVHWPQLDLLTSTFPCQDISVAGKRAGLAGERSGLFHESMRVVDALRPRAILIENVEGLYSSGSPRGSDFGIVLDSLAARGYLATWRTLDAQFFGVPQRRRRVFVVAIADGDPGAERIGEVLAVAESSGGDSPTSDPTWPHIAPAARGGAEGGSGDGGDSVMRERERVVPAITAKWAKGSGGPAGDECQNLVWSEPSQLRATPNTRIRRWSEVGSSSPLTTSRVERERESRECPDSEHPERRGREERASRPPDRGAADQRGVGVNPGNDEIAGTLVANANGGQRTTDIAGAYVTSVTGQVTHALTSEGHDASEDGTGRGTPVIGFSHTQGLDPQAREEMTPTLRSGGGGQAVAFSHYSSDPSPSDVSPTMRSGTNVSGHAVAHGPTVRRLTPLECERLMGWPDGWTDVPWNKKEHAPDSRRYAACGNGVAAPVAYWIGARLAEVLR